MVTNNALLSSTPATWYINLLILCHLIEIQFEKTHYVLLYSPSQRHAVRDNHGYMLDDIWRCL